MVRRGHSRKHWKNTDVTQSKPQDDTGGQYVMGCDVIVKINADTQYLPKNRACHKQPSKSVQTPPSKKIDAWLCQPEGQSSFTLAAILSVALFLIHTNAIVFEYL